MPVATPAMTHTASGSAVHWSAAEEEEEEQEPARTDCRWLLDRVRNGAVDAVVVDFVHVVVVVPEADCRADKASAWDMEAHACRSELGSHAAAD